MMCYIAVTLMTFDRQSNGRRVLKSLVVLAVITIVQANKNSDWFLDWLIDWLTLSFRFNGHFSGWTWVTGFIEAKDDGSGEWWQLEL